MSKDSDEIISIKVAGVEYQLHCPKDEQRGLLNAADYLNKKVRKIKRQAKFLSMEKASVLAGLEVANELLNSDKVEISWFLKFLSYLNYKIVIINLLSGLFAS